jgi:hypothetical protein
LFYSFLWRICQSYAYYLLAGIEKSRVGVFFKAQVSSLFVMDFVPLGGLGGESFRVYYLKNYYPKDLSRIFAGIILYNIISFLILFFFFFFSILYFTLVYPLEFSQKVAIYTLLIFFMILFYLVFFLQKRGFVDQLLAFIGLLPFLRPLTDKARIKVQKVDEVIKTFFLKDPKRFFKVTISLLIVRILGVVEVFLITYYLNDLFNFKQALFLTVVDNFVQSFFFFLPGGQIGFLEGFVNMMGQFLALSFVTVTVFSVWKRIRSIFWDFIGLLIVIFERKRIFKFFFKSSTCNEMKKDRIN